MYEDIWSTHVLRSNSTLAVSSLEVLLVVVVVLVVLVASKKLEASVTGSWMLSGELVPFAVHCDSNAVIWF